VAGLRAPLRRRGLSPRFSEGGEFVDRIKWLPDLHYRLWESILGLTAVAYKLHSDMDWQPPIRIELYCRGLSFLSSSG